ncbi:hypothetical protein B0H19DRAFT_1070657 [Mycena capillaripes]|nr:hypothetical protein B0H19DRAFT_1070657 [Mycena capillaripes]
MTSSNPPFLKRLSNFRTNRQKEYPSRQRSPFPESLPTTTSASHVHAQLQSPFCAMLYPDVRSVIFTLALTEYPDLARPYPKDELYYRPGFEFARKVDIGLLLTCRLIYLETHLEAVALNEHVFWMHCGPPPPAHAMSKGPRDHNTYLVRMTPQQRAAEWAPGFALHTLAITIRYTDWETRKTLFGDELHIAPPAEGWGWWIGSMPQLQELELEFETSGMKMVLLEERVQEALGWTFPLKDGDSLVHDGAAPVQSIWVRTPPQHRSGWSLYQRQWLDLELHVRNFSWKSKDFLSGWVDIFLQRDSRLGLAQPSASLVSYFRSILIFHLNLIVDSDARSRWDLSYTLFNSSTEWHRGNGPIPQARTSEVREKRR